jgi:RecQ family ATP-dependent DNA helicase
MISDLYSVDPEVSLVTTTRSSIVESTNSMTLTKVDKKHDYPGTYESRVQLVNIQNNVGLCELVKIVRDCFDLPALSPEDENYVAQMQERRQKQAVINRESISKRNAERSRRFNEQRREIKKFDFNQDLVAYKELYSDELNSREYESSFQGYYFGKHFGKRCVGCSLQPCVSGSTKSFCGMCEYYYRNAMYHRIPYLPERVARDECMYQDVISKATLCLGDNLETRVREFMQSTKNFWNSAIDDFDHSCITPGSTNETVAKAIEDALKTIFKMEKFRSKQYDAICAIVAGRVNSFTVMATGGGKSLCYQLPALLDERYVTFVISPLVSLIYDQFSRMKDLRLPAAAFSSVQSYSYQRDVFRDLVKGIIPIIFLTPEKAATKNFENLLNRLLANGKKLRFIVDEAHCILEWDEFRSYYAVIGLANQFDQSRFHFFTATATKADVDEVLYRFCMYPFELLFADPPKEPRTKILYDEHSMRSNLRYVVRPGTGRTDDIAASTNNITSGQVIVYCASPAEVATMYTDLAPKLLGKDLDFFHGKLSSEQKKDVMERWRTNRSLVMIATCAFGMGIDSEHVRLIIHARVPASMTSYLQETGRAGRDGGNATCILYSPTKHDIKRVFGIVTRGIVNNIHAMASARKRLKTMEVFAANALICRRHYLRFYFDTEHVVSEDDIFLCLKTKVNDQNIAYCDVCSRYEGRKFDVTIIDVESAWSKIASILLMSKTQGMAITSNILTLIACESKDQSIANFSDLVERGKEYPMDSSINQKLMPSVIDRLIWIGALTECYEIKSDGTLGSATLDVDSGVELQVAHPFQKQLIIVSDRKKPGSDSPIRTKKSKRQKRTGVVNSTQEPSQQYQLEPYFTNQLEPYFMNQLDPYILNTPSMSQESFLLPVENNFSFTESAMLELPGWQSGSAGPSNVSPQDSQQEEPDTPYEDLLNQLAQNIQRR